MEKVDKDTGKKVTLSNAIFKVYKLDTDTNDFFSTQFEFDSTQI